MRYVVAFVFALFIFVPTLARASRPPCHMEIVDAGTYPDGGTWTRYGCIYHHDEPGCGGLLGAGLPVAAGVVLLPMVGRRRRS